MATEQQVRSLNDILGPALLEQPFFSGIGITQENGEHCSYMLLSRKLKPHETDLISKLVPPEHKGVRIVTRVVGAGGHLKRLVTSKYEWTNWMTRVPCPKLLLLPTALYSTPEDLGFGAISYHNCGFIVDRFFFLDQLLS
jgi:hypothetical protein